MSQSTVNRIPLLTIWKNWSDLILHLSYAYTFEPQKYICQKTGFYIIGLFHAVTTRHSNLATLHCSRHSLSTQTQLSLHLTLLALCAWCEHTRSAPRGTLKWPHQCVRVSEIHPDSRFEPFDFHHLTRLFCRYVCDVKKNKKTSASPKHTRLIEDCQIVRVALCAGVQRATFDIGRRLRPTSRRQTYIASVDFPSLARNSFTENRNVQLTLAGWWMMYVNGSIRSLLHCARY